MNLCSPQATAEPYLPTRRPYSVKHFIYSLLFSFLDVFIHTFFFKKNPKQISSRKLVFKCNKPTKHVNVWLRVSVRLASESKQCKYIMCEMSGCKDSNKYQVSKGQDSIMNTDAMYMFCPVVVTCDFTHMTMQCILAKLKQSRDLKKRVLSSYVFI